MILTDDERLTVLMYRRHPDERIHLTHLPPRQVRAMKDRGLIHGPDWLCFLTNRGKAVLASLLDGPQTVPTVEDCNDCGGTGHADGERLDVDLYADETCRNCGGTGEVELETFDRDEADLEKERTDG